MLPSLVSDSLRLQVLIYALSPGDRNDRFRALQFRPQLRCISHSEKSMIRSIPLIALLLAMTQLSAADFSGQWAGTIEMNTGRFPFYVTLTFNDAKVNGFVSTGVQARPIRVENSVLGDNDLSFDIHDDADRLVHFRLTLSAGVLGGEATVGGDTWKVAVVSVGGGGGGDRAPTPVILPGGGLGGSSGGGSGPYRIGSGVSAPLSLSIKSSRNTLKRPVL